MINIQFDKSIFLTFLQDEEVKRRIIEIANVEKNNTNEKTIQYDIEKLQNELSKKEVEIKNLLETIQSQKYKINDYVDEKDAYDDIIFKIENERDKFKELLEKQIRMFGNISDIYNLYRMLSDETKAEIKGIFKRDNIENFIVCGSQIDNIQMLWDYIKSKIIENENMDVENLKLIFNYFFEKYNEIHDGCMYDRLNVNINDEFDTNIHTRSSDSKASGEVKEVLLEGYKNSYTNKVERKSIVRL